MKSRSRERIYIVPRWRAVFFGLVLLFIFGLGFALPSARPLTQTLGVALLVAGVVVLIQSNDNLRGIKLTVLRPGMAPAGGEIVLDLALRNDSESERLGLEMRHSAHWLNALRIREPILAGVPVINPGQSLGVRIAIPVPRRGRWPVPDLWVGSILPGGLCYAWKVFVGEGEYVVYPRPHGVPLNWNGSAGAELVAGSGDENQDVSGHRPYEAGDPLSRLDWRVFARRGKVVVRTLEEGGGGEIWLRWSDTQFCSGVEARLEQLSCWIEQCVRESRPFRLQLDSRRELTHRNLPACYEALATFAEEPA